MPPAASNTVSSFHETRIQRLETSSGVTAANVATVSAQVEHAQETLQELKEGLGSMEHKILAAVEKGATETNAKIEATNTKIDAVSVRVVALETKNLTEENKASVAKLFGKYAIAPILLVGGALLGKFGEKIFEWLTSP